MRKLLPFIASLLLITGLRAAEYPKMGEDVYDTQADGQQLIDTALSQAKAHQKNVLLVFGANWCIWCHRLHDTFTHNAKVAAELKHNYIVVPIDVNTRHGQKRNAAVIARYGNPIRFGLPVLVVLDASGKQLATQETGALEDGAAHSPAKIMTFLQVWEPPKFAPAK